MDNSYQINKFQQRHNQNQAECNSVEEDGVKEGDLSLLLNTHGKALETCCPVWNIPVHERDGQAGASPVEDQGLCTLFFQLGEDREKL